MGDALVVRESPTGEIEQANEAAGARKYFLQLLPDAMAEMRRILKVSSNEKLRAEVAKEVIELAGAGGNSQKGQVVINDSQVQLLLQVGREVLEGK